MMRIRSLPPNVSRNEAIEAFSYGVAGTLKQSLFGRLRGVAEFYIPFQLFRAEIINSRAAREEGIFGIDAVHGSLDLFHFSRLLTDDQLVDVQTRNSVPASLDGTQARDLATEKIQRVLFGRGFFRLRNSRISIELVPGQIHVPYWVGFHGRDNRARFAVLDAVRRKFEGAKVRQILQEWIAAS